MENTTFVPFVELAHKGDSLEWLGSQYIWKYDVAFYFMSKIFDIEAQKINIFANDQV